MADTTNDDNGMDEDTILEIENEIFGVVEKVQTKRTTAGQGDEFEAALDRFCRDRLGIEKDPDESDPERGRSVDEDGSLED